MKNAKTNRSVDRMPAGTASFFTFATNELVVMNILISVFGLNLPLKIPGLELENQPVALGQWSGRLARVLCLRRFRAGRLAAGPKTDRIDRKNQPRDGDPRECPPASRICCIRRLWQCRLIRVIVGELSDVM